MVNISSKQIEQAKYCGDIFDKNPTQAKKQYHELAKLYHPDALRLLPLSESDLINKTNLFVKINELYEQAIKNYKYNLWQKTNYIEIPLSSGKNYTIDYVKESEFELGNTYLTQNNIYYLFDVNYETFCENAKIRINDIQYPDKKMENAFSLFVPQKGLSFEKTKDNKFLIKINKNPDLIVLSDLFKHYNFNIPERHVAWIISRLSNLCCFFDYLKIAHNGIDLNSCFISPANHTLAILGGWQYSSLQNTIMIGTTKDIYALMSPKIKSNKIASIQTDLESVKSIGRKLLGTQIPPQSFINFLKKVLLLLL